MAEPWPPLPGTQGPLSWALVGPLANYNAQLDVAQRKAEQARLGQNVTHAAASVPTGLAQALVGLGAYPHDYAAGTAKGDPVQWATDLATTLAGGSSAVPGAANDLRMGIKAYHGSPHDFEKFDSSKIGTGEGAQAYGHGLYFAERPGVAESYRNMDHPAIGNDPRDDITALRQNWQMAGTKEMTPEMASSLMKDFASLRSLADDPDIALNVARYVNGAEPAGTVSSEAMFALRSLDNQLPPKPQGKTYEVSINAHPDEFLDWDKPLSQQSPQVQEAMRKAYPGFDARAAAGSAPSHLSGLDDPARVAELRAAGIKGIRYADQGSRGPSGWRILSPQDSTSGKWVVGSAPNGPNKFFVSEAEARSYYESNLPPNPTHNYVVFDDKTVEILKKYGLAGLTALGAGAGYAANQPQQSTTGKTIPAGTPIY